MVMVMVIYICICDYDNVYGGETLILIIPQGYGYADDNGYGYDYV